MINWFSQKMWERVANIFGGQIKTKQKNRDTFTLQIGHLNPLRRYHHPL